MKKKLYRSSETDDEKRRRSIGWRSIGRAKPMTRREEEVSVECNRTIKKKKRKPFSEKSFLGKDGTTEDGRRKIVPGKGNTGRERRVEDRSREKRKETDIRNSSRKNRLKELDESFRRNEKKKKYRVNGTEYEKKKGQSK